MKILVATSDLTPLLSADARPDGAVPGLPLAFQRAGHEVSLAAPLLPAVEKSGALKIKPTGVQINVPLGSERVSVQVNEARTSEGLQTFLFRHEGTFGRLAEAAPGASHMDAAAAALFSKLVVELARRLNPAPDVIQIEDWPGALIPLFLKTQHLPFTSVLALADPTAQGSFPIEDFGLLNLGWEYFRPTGVEFYGRLNFLKSGIVAAPGHRRGRKPGAGRPANAGTRRRTRCSPAGKRRQAARHPRRPGRANLEPRQGPAGSPPLPADEPRR